jgi:hypothetical protein
MLLNTKIIMDYIANMITCKDEQSVFGGSIARGRATFFDRTPP